MFSCVDVYSYEEQQREKALLCKYISDTFFFRFDLRLEAWTIWTKRKND